MREASYEEKIEFLEGYREAKRDEINFKIESEALLDCKILTSPMITGMPKAQCQTDLSELEILIEEKQNEYTRKRYMTLLKATQIIDCINKLENITEREVLLRRYIKLDSRYNYQCWNHIAQNLGYSRSQIWNYFKSAVNNLQIK